MLKNVLNSHPCQDGEYLFNHVDCSAAVVYGCPLYLYQTGEDPQRLALFRRQGIHFHAFQFNGIFCNDKPWNP